MAEYATYREMGTPNRKTGRIPYYKVQRHMITNDWSCTCPAAEFSRHSECKHVKHLKHKLRLV